MANISVTSGARARPWLDRPLLPARERLVLLAARWEFWAYATLIVAGFALRVWDVGSRAMHHDESLHAYFAWKLFAGQGYGYDPLMHGPLQFEVVPLFYLLFGDNEASSRLLAVVLGTVLIGLPYLLRSYLTRPGALLAGAMLAISPSFVYFSRFIRDDIYLACFTLVMFIAIVRFLESYRPGWLYVLAASAALALASMEAAYLTFFIFGTFLIFAGVLEWLSRRPGPILTAMKNTSMDTWLTALSIFVVITIVCYSSFFTNPDGIWDRKHSFFLPGQEWTLHGLNPARRDILGGLFYWKAQHTVQRGNEPTFYYLLLLPLYEQLALIFGLAGMVYTCIRRSLATTFLVWWAVMAFGLYSWAGEKMPWLVIHVALPLILLAGLFLGSILRSARRPVGVGITLTAFLLAALETHSTFLLNYVDAANPTEMLIYVQTSQDVPNTVNELAALSQRVTHGPALPIGVDSTDVGGWPFTWYLRHFTNVTETTTFTGPACNGQPCSVLLMLGPEYDQYSGQLNRDYVVQKYRWNWWFPQDYMTWFPNHVGGPFDGSVAPPIGVGTRDDWKHVWDWLIYRRPFGDRGARWLYVLVKRNLVPDARYFVTQPSSAANAAQMQIPQMPSHYLGVLGSAAGPGALSGPRGIAPDGRGGLLVADTLNHRVVDYGPNGGVRAVIGGPGDASGQFAVKDSPQGVAAAPNGDIYVADTWHQRIQVFTSSGHPLRMWGEGQIGSGPAQFYGPRSLAVGQNGRVYVADTGNKRIQVFSASGRYVMTIGSAGAGAGQFNEPSAVSTGPHGDLYVADFWNRRIQVFSAGGTFIRSWPVPDWTVGSYDEPYLAVDRTSGNVVASDPQQRKILVFSPLGQSLGAVSSDRLVLPVGVAVLTGHKIAVGDPTGNHAVLLRINARSSVSRARTGMQPVKPMSTAIKP
ncbi:MAG: hypothetical protein PVSMB7_06380 [Chloroflexota bacterium]